MAVLKLRVTLGGWQVLSKLLKTSTGHKRLSLQRLSMEQQCLIIDTKEGQWLLRPTLLRTLHPTEALPPKEIITSNRRAAIWPISSISNYCCSSSNSNSCWILRQAQWHPLLWAHSLTTRWCKAMEQQTSRTSMSRLRSKDRRTWARSLWITKPSSRKLTRRRRWRHSQWSLVLKIRCWVTSSRVITHSL